ncbi:MAG: M23 family metallopeptidase [Thermodesulfobacteriota bacterium]
MESIFTLVILQNRGSRIHQVSFSRSFVRLVGLIMGASFMVILGAAYDYYHLKQAAVDNSSLLQQAALQREEIARQQRQIHSFAGELHTLKSKLVRLNDFEKSIRIIANITQPNENKSFFGIGGSTPEEGEPLDKAAEHPGSMIRELHVQVASLGRAAEYQHSEFETILKQLREKQNTLASTPSILPARGRITSRFGYRRSPFTGRREMHKGLDIAASMGEPIAAAADGIVSFVGKKSFLGKIVVIDHGHGVSTRYAHCGRLLKKVGDRLRRGDIIAHVGNTGRSTGPHLHYEVRLNGVQVNPENYLLDMVSDPGIKLARLDRTPKFAK